MVDETPKAETPQENLPPGAVAHYLHWAHVFMERYYQEKGWDIQQAPSSGMVRRFLEEMDHQIGEFQNIEDIKERTSELGKFVVRCERKLTDTILSALVFARTISARDQIPQGDGEPDDKNPNEKSLTKDNFDRLANGLLASIASLGAAYGNLNKQGARPITTGYAPLNRNQEMLSNTYAGHLGQKMGGGSRLVVTNYSDTRSDFCKAYLGGYYGAQKSRGNAVG